MALFSKAAIERRLGLQDARGPQGMFSRGSNIYRGGMPMAHAGGGNPNLGRPSTEGVTQEDAGVTPSNTTLFGSLPPNGGTPDATMNNAVMDLLKRHLSQRSNIA
jgi:hypothetical protein